MCAAINADFQLTCGDGHRLCVPAVAVQASGEGGAYSEGVVFPTVHVGEVTAGAFSEAFSNLSVRALSHGDVVSCVVGGIPGVYDDITGALTVYIGTMRWAGCCEFV